MDPSIMKFLEEDEDETMHSGADVEAFTAALNRDIGGDTSTSQPSDSDSTPLSQGSNPSSSQLFPQWQSSSQDENANDQNQHVLNGSQQQEQGPENRNQLIDTSQNPNGIHLQRKQPKDECQQRQVEQNILHFSQTMGMQNSDTNSVHIRESDRAHNPESESPYPKLQKMNNQQAMAAEQTMNPMTRGKQVPFALLLPVLLPQLDKDRGMQLHTVYTKLKKNEITKDTFVRHMRAVVGDQMLKMAVYKLQAQAARNSQTGPNQLPMQSQASAQPQQGNVPQSFAQLHQRAVTSSADVSHIPSSAAQLKTYSSNAIMDNNGQISREIERQSDSHGISASQMPSSGLSNINQERLRPTIPLQGLSKQQQQHFSQTSFPIDGNPVGNYHPFSGANVSTSASSLKQQPHDSQVRQGPVYQSIGATQLGTATQVMNVLSAPKFERQNEAKRGQGGTLPHMTSNSALPYNSVHWQSSTGKEQKNGALSSMTYAKQEPVDQGSEQQLKSRLSFPQGLSSFNSVQVERGNEDEALDMQSSRTGFSTSTSMMPLDSVSSSMMTQLDPSISLNSRIPSASFPVGPGNNAKTPPKKPSIGQKKLLESLGSSPPLSSKKQKVSGALSDQSIEQLNDVAAVSGVNIREEEEQLLSGPKEDSRVSEASRRVVQEEEERLILQKIPLQKKLAEIISKCGLKSISNDVERCLSLCVEERMHGLICNLIRLSKQRVDIERPRHRTVITSDVQQQILTMNQKAREEWDKKQTEAEKLQNLDEQPEGSAGVDCDKANYDLRLKSLKDLKANKEEDDKIRTTAANVAARAAVGGDDMLSKWQLMAEQARQKREGGIDVASGSQAGKDVSHKPISTFGKNERNNQEAEKRDHPTASMTSGLSRKSARNQVMVSQPKVTRSISVKDVIAVLEREPQMSKTTLIYRLHENPRANAVAE
ncbi:transcription initiation factor TFIID subunit 4b-like isoform X1 [Actinidia eriantha]|uniref:transcription initiation factor TFIID subunit 4b-like isoform X1 n=2 Tax=Actinidia eriantha TaxID=165200 RepID=UPI002587CAA7|nr:transcription initiation factor TFIID subunit 4b-like isoform X1 [Actinidia eriantha]